MSTVDMTEKYQEAFDNGRELFKTESELILCEVWNRASDLYPDFDEVDCQYEYVEGYKAARRQRDEYEREKGELA